MGLFIMKAYGKTYLQFGDVISVADKTTKDGCNLFVDENPAQWARFLMSDGQVQFYSTNITLKTITAYLVALKGLSVDTRIWNCMFSEKVTLANCFSANIYNFHCVNGDSVIRRMQPDTVVERVGGNKMMCAIWWQTYDGTVRDVWARNCDYGCRISSMGGLVKDCYLIDCDMDNWSNYWWAGSEQTTIYRQYSVNLEVVDKDGDAIENVEVVLYDKDNNKLFSVESDAAGKIVEQIVTYGTYCVDDGDVMTSKSPHKLTVRKRGFDKYEIVFECDEKIDWRIKLKRVIKGKGILKLSY